MCCHIVGRQPSCDEHVDVVAPGLEDHEKHSLNAETELFLQMLETVFIDREVSLAVERVAAQDLVEDEVRDDTVDVFGHGGTDDAGVQPRYQHVGRDHESHCATDEADSDRFELAHGYCVVANAMAHDEEEGSWERHLNVEANFLSDLGRLAEEQGEIFAEAESYQYWNGYNDGDQKLSIDVVTT